MVSMMVRACSAGDHTGLIAGRQARARSRQDFPGERHLRGDRVGQVDPPLGLDRVSRSCSRRKAAVEGRA